MFSCRWHRSSPSCALELITSASLWLSGSLKNFLLIIGSDHFIKVIQEDRNRESRVEVDLICSLFLSDNRTQQMVLC